MTNEQKQVKEWMQAFGQETPEKPIIPNLEVRKLRLKLIMEEAIEIANALGFSANFDFSDFKEEPSWIDLKAIADGCEDLKVVTEGTLVACGLCQEPKRISIDKLEKILNEPYNPEVMVNKANADPLFDEVMRSNWSKFWTTTEVNQKVVTDGDSPAFDATAIIATNTLCDEEGNTYKAVGHDKWLVKDKNGKVLKSPSYSPPKLQPIIDELSK